MHNNIYLSWLMVSWRTITLVHTLVFFKCVRKRRAFNIYHEISVLEDVMMIDVCIRVQKSVYLYLLQVIPLIAATENHKWNKFKEHILLSKSIKVSKDKVTEQFLELVEWLCSRIGFLSYHLWYSCFGILSITELLLIKLVFLKQRKIVEKIKEIMKNIFIC